MSPTRLASDPRDVLALTTPSQLVHDVWEKVLLCQFHDVLPGSSIGMVHRDARVIYKDCIGMLSDLISRAIAAWVPATTSSALCWPSSMSSFAFDDVSFVPSAAAGTGCGHASASHAAANMGTAPITAVTVVNMSPVSRTAVVEVPFQWLGSGAWTHVLLCHRRAVLAWRRCC